MAKKLSTSPRGVAVFPRLDKPDTKYDSDGVYQVKLRLKSKDKKTVAFTDAIDVLVEQSYKDAVDKNSSKTPGTTTTGGKKIVKVKKSESLPYTTDEETGDILVNFKTKASGKKRDSEETWKRGPIPVFAKNGTPMLDAKVGGGTVLSVSYEPYTWFTVKEGAGVTLRLEAVMVYDLKEYGGRSATGFGFETESDDEETEGEQQEETAEENGGDGGDF